MDALIQNIRDFASPTGQALAVSVGGLIGVFATLGFFFLLILVADRLSSRKQEDR